MQTDTIHTGADQPTWRVAPGDDYDTAWSGTFVVEELGYWGGSWLRYARPDYEERGMAFLAPRFATMGDAMAAIDRARRDGC